eukprot:1156039-Pelagomonas_calceolata.AAC.10
MRTGTLIGYAHWLCERKQQNKFRSQVPSALLADLRPMGEIPPLTLFVNTVGLMEEGDAVGCWARSREFAVICNIDVRTGFSVVA